MKISLSRVVQAVDVCYLSKAMCLQLYGFGQKDKRVKGVDGTPDTSLVATPD